MGFPIGAGDALAITAFAITSLVTDLINIVSATLIKIFNELVISNFMY